MINNLYLKNFKNIQREIKIRFAPITVIFGLNNVGKSSIIQSLDIISNLSDKFRLPLLTKYKNYGSIESIINKMWPGIPASICLDVYQRNKKNSFKYSFSKTHSKIDYFDNNLDNNFDLIQTIEFNKDNYAYFKEINLEQKKYSQLFVTVYEVIRNPDNQFLVISSALENLINYKKYQFIYDEYGRGFELSPHGNIDILKYQLGDSNLWIKKIEAEFLDKYGDQLLSKKSENLTDLFSDLFNDFKSKKLKSGQLNKYLKYFIEGNSLSMKNFKDTLIINAFYTYVERSVFASIFIKKYDDKTLRTLSMRLQMRLNYLRLTEIKNRDELNYFLDNLKNIRNFFKLAMEKDTSKKRLKAKRILYRCIKGYKLSLPALTRDPNMNLLKIIQSIKPLAFSSIDTSSENRELRLPYDLRIELNKFIDSVPKLNIFHNQITDERIFTHQNNNSYLDKLYENRNNKIFINYIIENLVALGFEVGELSINSDENSFRVKIGKIDLADCGTGLKNILSIIVQLYDHTNLASRISKPIYDQITCIEEPEANLHPKFQAELGNLIANASKAQVQQRNQILIETHSQNLTLRLLKLVRNGQLSKSDIAFNCLFSDHGDISVFSPEILSNGSFDGSWPGGFFEESLSELYD